MRIDKVRICDRSLSAQIENRRSLSSDSTIRSLGPVSRSPVHRYGSILKTKGDFPFRVKDRKATVFPTPPRQHGLLPEVGRVWMEDDRLE